ncbi:hypothetical protein B9Z55_000943 [Caenorhabditis nigoni]|uniref:Uncharacterized protein n=1 Tax=Caenorhabditis nigoni TaxID=1611254 RepID=A0A2G5VVK9_9PELO|nr:hypothetical protein B9Z55_000943 [Caenorhabditis nigoni]
MLSRNEQVHGHDTPYQVQTNGHSYFRDRTDSKISDGQRSPYQTEDDQTISEEHKDSVQSTPQIKGLGHTLSNL